MAVYKSLLVDTGSGVIDRTKQAERNSEATVILGLGGTGKDAVIKLKKEVYRQLKPDDVDAVIPEYKNIKYLIIDSDSDKITDTSRNVSNIDKYTEFFSISSYDLAATFSAKHILKFRPELYWLNHEGIHVPMRSYGNCGIRQIGRYLLVDKAASLYAKIKSTIHNALIGSNGNLTIHICSGICGATGSGIFLDVCYLVREALQELGEKHAIICGYFFLPDVNLCIPEISADNLIVQYLSVNGFAALTELNYCMNFSKNKDSFQMNYGFKKIDTTEPPVDMCYLISAKDKNGQQIPNGYCYALGIVTDFIIHLLVKDESGMSFRGYISKVNCMLGMVKAHHGANIEYNILGTSVAKIPLSKINTYLGTKLFECYTEIYEKIPTEKERDNFLQRNLLKYEDIKRDLCKGCMEQIDFPKRLDAREFIEHGNARFVEFADNYLTKNLEQLEKNTKILLQDLENYDISKKNNSLIDRTYHNLCEEYLTQLSYGPFFAQRMLYGSQNQNLIHAIDNFIEQNKADLDAEQRQIVFRSQKYDEVLFRMQSTNILDKEDSIQNYLNVLHNLYVHHYKVKMLQTLQTVLQNYREQLIQLNNTFFKIVLDTFATLENTFEVNKTILMSNLENNRNHYEIISLSELQSMLDKEVQQLNIQDVFSMLITTLLSNYSKWKNGDTFEITKLISDFILETFKETREKTITDYLKIKFGTDDINLLAQIIEENIIAKLKKNSTPLFWKNPMWNDDIVETNKLMIPKNSPAIQQVANDYKNTKIEILLQELDITDKISMIQFYSGIPLYAYQGIFELQQQYEKDTDAGKHLYESEEMDWNKWLPSPIPASIQMYMQQIGIQEKNQVLHNELEKQELISNKMEE